MAAHSIIRTALYARISTSNNGQSPEMQLRELREYCERRGWTVAGEYVDAGISGAKDRRPELDRLMANLIASGVSTDSILAVTFTNKAAEEMRARVSDLLLRAGVPPAQPWASTFHSLCARLLRREAPHAGLPRNFAVYDDDDQTAAVKLAMAKLKIEDDALTPRNVLSRISYAKNHAQTPEMLRA